MSFLDTLFGGAFGLVQQDANNRFNASEAEKQRQFNAEQAELAFNRSLSADSTKYQRQVSDLSAAGLNPMLAVSQSAGSVQASPASGDSASGSLVNLGSLISAISQNKVADAEVKLKEAETANTEADTALKRATESETIERERGSRIVNDIQEATKTYQIERARLDNDLSEANRKLIYKSIDEAGVRMSKMQAEIDTEYGKQALMKLEGALKQASAYQIYELLPYQKALSEAQTSEAKNAAALSAVHTAYQQGLVDNGYIEAIARDATARAGSAESREVTDAIAAGLRTGNWPDSIKNDGNLWKALFTPQGALSSMTILLDNLNPLAGLLK